MAEEKEEKIPTSVRLTATAQSLCANIAKHTGLSRSGVIETAIRRLAKDQGIRLPEGEALSEAVYENGLSPGHV